MTPIGVNLLWLVPGVVGGSEQYLCRQLVGLADDPGEVEPVLFVLPGFADAHPELVGRFPMVTATVDGANRAARVWVEATWLAGRVRNLRLALVHHGGGTIPLRRGGARPLLTVHDLQYVRFPHHFSTTKLAYLQWAVPRSVERAAAITCPSGYVKTTIAETFRYPAERILVVTHGIPASEEVRTPPTPEAVVRDRYGLPGPFVVYPAITYPHKNHAVLVEAMTVLRHRWPDLRLVLIGGVGAAETPLRELIAARGVADVIVRPGRISAEDRDGLYACATALVFPSRYEGFGAPVLEAMRAGCPVIAADTTALPEVVGDAGILVDPLDTDAWIAAIDSLVGDDARRAVLAAAGRDRAGSFTAARSAAELRAAYRLALA